jgi:putative polyketide hydroxylase
LSTSPSTAQFRLCLRIIGDRSGRHDRPRLERRHLRPDGRTGGQGSARLADPRRETVSTIDLSDGRFVVLAAGRSWAEAARRVAREMDVELDAWVVGSDEDADLGDPDGAWARVYDVGSEGAVLIRPDGHVAWRSRSAADDPPGELRSALETVLHRRPSTTGA